MEFFKIRRTIPFMRHALIFNVISLITFCAAVFFLVHRGHFRLELRDRVLELGPGELVIVPRGVEHRPVADEEVEVLLFEPATTLNTGNVRNDRTLDELARL